MSNVFGILDTAILVLLGLHSTKSRRIMRKEIARLKMVVMAAGLKKSAND